MRYVKKVFIFLITNNKKKRIVNFLFYKNLYLFCLVVFLFFMCLIAFLFFKINLFVFVFSLFTSILGAICPFFNKKSKILLVFLMFSVLIKDYSFFLQQVVNTESSSNFCSDADGLYPFFNENFLLELGGVGCSTKALLFEIYKEEELILNIKNSLFLKKKYLRELGESNFSSDQYGVYIASTIPEEESLLLDRVRKLSFLKLKLRG